MPGIEDPYEEIERQHIDESNPYFKSMLEVFGKFVPLAGLLYVIQKQFSPDAALARVKALVDQLAKISFMSFSGTSTLLAISAA